ncbi:hypothetical protein R1flu_006386 [Riccia fluitans]|uniref:Smr domain-containing protein n=1 Tax=Riccia fluitans TaxID=41844 RepID=A0ABD1YVW1_9MARC
MLSKNDGKISFCSERMKLCQKHLAKVYDRSKHIFLRARLGKESSYVHPASAVGTHEDIHSKTVKSTSKVSPYFSAVSGLFGPTLLRRLHFRSFQSSVGKSSAESPRASCPRFCKHGKHDSSSIPVFFDKLPISRPVSHPAPSWGLSREAIRQRSARAYSHKPENAAEIDKKEKDMGLLTAYCDQCSVRGNAGAYERAGLNETRASRPTSRIGLMPEEIVLSNQQKSSRKPWLGPRSSLSLSSAGEVGCSHKWDLVDCSSETGVSFDGRDDFSRSAAMPLLKHSHQARGQDSCENSKVCTKENVPGNFPLTAAEAHPSDLSRITCFSELAVPREDALTEHTLSSCGRDSPEYKEQGSDRRWNKFASLARATKSNTKRLERSSKNLWKYGSMALCTENPVRGYTTGSPPAFKDRPSEKKVSWGKSGNRKLVSHICLILKENGWGPVTVETLDSLEEKLDSYIVNAVLQQIKDPSVALKFFRWAKQREGYKHDVYTYTTMMNVLGRARNLSGVRHLLQEMHNDGCEPTVVTYNTLILTYGKVKSLSESLRVFRIMKESGCQPDTITYSILIHLCVKSGFQQEALKLYQGMQEAGLQPDTVTYSIVIDSLGRAGKLTEARKLFREMREKGCQPNEFTYNSLIDRHAKSGQTKFAVRYYEEMRKNSFPLNPVVCTTMMGVLASLGQYTEAEALFSEMLQANIAADTAAYSLMINMWGQAGDLDKAVSWFGRMLGNMVTPSLSTFTALLNAHLDSHLYEGAEHFLTSMAMWGISPDLKVYTSLLRHCTGCEKQEHVDAVLGLMDRLGHSAHKFVFDLLTSKNQDRRNTRKRVEKFLGMVQHEDQDSKQAFANALIEFLHKLQCKTDPGFVWEIAFEKRLFPSSIIRRELPNHWLIDLHYMSVGTGLVALPRLLLILRDNWVRTPTKRVYIVTGWGKRSRVTGSSSLKNSVNELLQAAKSPFSVDHTNAGVFVSYGVPFCDWITLPLSRRRLGLDVA